MTTATRKSSPNGFDITVRPDRFEDPLKWRKPAQIFVNSMSDLFHREISDRRLVQIWGVMLRADHHTYQILTKRPHRMVQKIGQLSLGLPDHIWLGVSVENQEFAYNRIPELLRLETESRFISAEPLLAAVNLVPWIADLGWVICGGESGPNRREMSYGWARAIRDDCARAGVPFFYKQGNGRKAGSDTILDGRQHQEFPERMRRDAVVSAPVATQLQLG